LFKYLVLSISLFVISLFGLFITRKHLIIMLMSFELLLLSSIILSVVGSIFLDNLLGQVYCLLILTVGATESAIVLAILIVYYRLRGSISIDLVNYLKG